MLSKPLSYLANIMIICGKTAENIASFIETDMILIFHVSTSSVNPQLLKYALIVCLCPEIKYINMNTTCQKIGYENPV